MAQVLQTAATVTMGENAAFEMFDYVISLREGIMDAWSGAILAMKTKRVYCDTSGENRLTKFSANSGPLCRVSILDTECNSSGPEPK